MDVPVAFLGVGRMGGRMCTRLLAGGLFVDAADGEVPLSELVLGRYREAGAAGLGGADSTNVAVLYERAAGVRLEVEA